MRERERGNCRAYREGERRENTAVKCVHTCTDISITSISSITTALVTRRFVGAGCVSVAVVATVCTFISICNNKVNFSGSSLLNLLGMDSVSNTDIEYWYRIPVFDISIQYQYSIPVFDIGIRYRYLVPVFDTGIRYRYSVPVFDIHNLDVRKPRKPVCQNIDCIVSYHIVSDGVSIHEYILK